MAPRKSVLVERVNELVKDARRRRAHVHGTAMNKLTALQYAQALPLLVDLGYDVDCRSTSHEYNALGMAITRLNIEVVTALLQFGANSNTPVGINGRSPLAHVIHLMQETSCAAKERRVLKSIAKTLLTYRALPSPEEKAFLQQVGCIPQDNQSVVVTSGGS